MFGLALRRDVDRQARMIEEADALISRQNSHIDRLTARVLELEHEVNRLAPLAEAGLLRDRLNALAAAAPEGAR